MLVVVLEFILTASAAFHLAEACSYFEVECPDNVWVIGRTLEAGMKGGGGLFLQRSGFLPELDTLPGLEIGQRSGAAMDKLWHINVHPRGIDGKFENVYGFLAFEIPALKDYNGFECMNEAGLTLSAHTMRMAEYQAEDPGKTTLAITEVADWICGRFDSVESVQDGLRNVTVSSEGFVAEEYLHWVIADAYGKSVILEFVDGQRHLHNNDARVMTNDPDYLWHLKNLNMYVGLSPHAPLANSDIQVDTEIGKVPQVWSQGLNLAGLPGDKSPAARFARLFFLRQYATLNDPVRSVEDGIVLGTALLNDVFIPRGAVAPLRKAFSPWEFDYTHYGVLKIPVQKRILFRSYRNMAWREVNLDSIDWNKQQTMPLSDGSLNIADVTHDFRMF